MPEQATRSTSTPRGDSTRTSGQKPGQLPVLLAPIVIFVFVLAVFWLPQFTSNAAATVNGETISRSELDRRAAFERVFDGWNGVSDPSSGPEATRFRAIVLDKMVESRLILQEAKKAGFTVPAQSVAGRIASLQSQLKLSDAQMNNDLTKGDITRQTLEVVMQEDAVVDAYLRTVVLKDVAQVDQETASRNWYNTILAKASIDKRIESGAARVGQPAPDFTLNDMSGNPVRLSDLRGKAVFINFFATWCNPCRAEMPDIESTWKSNKDKGLVVLEVNLANLDTVSDVAKFIKEFGLTMPLVLDEKGSIASLYRVGPIPSSYFVNRQGVLVAVKVGGMSRQAMEERIASILQ